MKQTIRIIGGLHRGKKLHFQVMEGLRPTPNRVRETLFNWLMHDIKEARCLDAFAGSGALGFEAYSRGAAKVVLIEQAPEAYANLQKLTLAFNSPKLSVRQGNACDYLKQTDDHFDIVFLDPPFATSYIAQCIDILTHTNLLVIGGLLYLESEHEVEMQSEIWEKVKLKRAGQVVYGLYRKNSQ